MNYVILYCTISIVFWVGTILWITNRSKDVLHPIVILLLFYILNYPVKMIATKFGIFLIDSNAIGGGMQIAAMLLSDFSMVLLCIAFFAKIRINCGIPFGRRMEKDSIGDALIFFFILSFVAGGIAYGTDSFFRIFSFSTMETYKLYQSAEHFGSTVEKLFVSIMAIAMQAFAFIGVFAMYRRGVKARTIFVFSIAVLTWYAYAQTLSKTSALMLLLVCVVAFNMCSKAEGGNGVPLKWIVIFGGISLFLMAEMELAAVLAVNKNSASGWFELVESFFNPSFDAPDNLVAIMNRMESFGIGELEFEPFLHNLFLSKIPRAIWLDKPTVMGKIVIVRELLPEFFISNTNYNSASPSIAGEAMASGGIVWLVIISLLYGIIFFNLYIVAQESNCLIPRLLYIFLVLNFNNFCRGGSDILGNLLYYYVLLSVVVFFYQCFEKIRMFKKNRAEVFTVLNLKGKGINGNT